MIASIPSATLLGVRGRPVLVEVHVSNGLPGFAVVGLPDAAGREARDRVRAALLSSALPWPLRRVTVNLAPSGVRKTGAGLDLPIAVGLLVATGELEPAAVAGCGFVGELGLDGTIRPVPGTLPLVDALASPTVVVPPSSVAEAALVAGPVVRTARSLPRARRSPVGPGRLAKDRVVRRQRRPTRARGGPGGGRYPWRKGPSRASGLLRGTGTVLRTPRRRGRCGGRAPPPPVGAARFGQDHAGGAVAGSAPAPRRRPASRDLPDPLGRRLATGSPQRPEAAVPGPAPGDLRPGPHWGWNLLDAPGRGQPRHQRRALPRRAR